jgi:hypothetical protein
MCVSIFSTTSVWNIPHSKKNWQRYDKNNVYWSSCTVPVILVGYFTVGRRLKSCFLLHGSIPGRDFRRFLTRRFVSAFVGKCNLLIYRVKM